MEDAKRTGGYLKEKAVIAMARMTDSELDKTIMKVTSHKLKVPNEKHLGRLIAMTHGRYEVRVPMDKIVKELEARLHTYNWVVVLKALIVLHTLLKMGSAQIQTAICSNLSIFHIRNIKDLSSDLRGSAQKRFINQYARYLEERGHATKNSGMTNRIESPKELDQEFSRLSTAESLRRMESYMLQLKVLTQLELSNLWGDNPATLHAFQLVIQDSKDLYVLLSRRCIWVLEDIRTFSDAEKMKAKELYESYAAHTDSLQKMYDTARDLRGYLGREPIPTLRPLPTLELDRLQHDSSPAVSPGLWPCDAGVTVEPLPTSLSAPPSIPPPPSSRAAPPRAVPPPPAPPPPAAQPAAQPAAVESPSPPVCSEAKMDRGDDLFTWMASSSSPAQPQNDDFIAWMATPDSSHAPQSPQQHQSQQQYPQQQQQHQQQYPAPSSQTTDLLHLTPQPVTVANQLDLDQLWSTPAAPASAPIGTVTTAQPPLPTYHQQPNYLVAATWQGPAPQ